MLGGFFIEAGAHNGEDLSNTLFLEVRQSIEYHMAIWHATVAQEELIFNIVLTS